MTGRRCETDTASRRTNTDLKPDNRLLHRDEEHGARLVGDVVALPPQARRDDGEHERLPHVDCVEHLINGRSVAGVLISRRTANRRMLQQYNTGLVVISEQTRCLYYRSQWYLLVSEAPRLKSCTTPPKHMPSRANACCSRMDSPRVRVTKGFDVCYSMRNTSQEYHG